MGSDALKAGDMVLYTEFKLTLPCGERLLWRSLSDTRYKFKLTLPCGERLRPEWPHHRLPEFKLTLPCGERLVLYLLLMRYVLI